jgi:hypothetical protein
MYAMRQNQGENAVLWASKGGICHGLAARLSLLERDADLGLPLRKFAGAPILG